MIQPSSKNELSPDLMESSLYEHVVDMIDMLLERASLNLDDEAGVAPSVSSIRDSLSFDRKRIFQETNSTLKKPQLEFIADIDNSRIRPFYPRLKLSSKPNSHPHSPLELTEHVLNVSSEEQLSYLGPKTYYPHPYEIEIKEFSKNIPLLRSYFDEIQQLKPQMPPGLTGYPLQYINTPEQLSEMIREIEHESAIAIDLEHHDYRTYQGLTCLMQVCSFPPLPF
jgi:exosome complex exonuclease RRP6